MVWLDEADVGRPGTLARLDRLGPRRRHPHARPRRRRRGARRPGPLAHRPLRLLRLPNAPSSPEAGGDQEAHDDVPRDPRRGVRRSTTASRPTTPRRTGPRTSDVRRVQSAAPLVDLLAELEPEFGPGSVFRPYRDVRFAKDKTPYKDHQGALRRDRRTPSATTCRSARDGPAVAGGWYDPPGPQVARYRDVVDGPGGAELERHRRGGAGRGLRDRRRRAQDAPARRRPGPPADRAAAAPFRGGGPALAARAVDAARARRLDEVRDAWRAMSPLVDWLAAVGRARRPGPAPPMTDDPEPDPAAGDPLAPAATRGRARRRGASASRSATYGVSYGALGTTSGLSVPQTCALSVLAFTGGSQFALRRRARRRRRRASSGVATALLLGHPQHAVRAAARAAARRARRCAGCWPRTSSSTRRRR